MEDTNKIFVEGLKKWAKPNKINQTALGKVVGRKQTTISAYYKGETRPETWMIDAWVKEFNLDYQEILKLGRSTIAKEEGSVVQYTSSIQKEHFEIVKKFQDQVTAKEFNHALLKLEKNNPKKYFEIYGMVRGLVAELESSKDKKEDNQKSASGE